jgi:hypothetical protein
MSTIPLMRPKSKVSLRRLRKRIREFPTNTCNGCEHQIADRMVDCELHGYIFLGVPDFKCEDYAKKARASG